MCCGRGGEANISILIVLMAAIFEIISKRSMDVAEAWLFGEVALPVQQVCEVALRRAQLAKDYVGV